ncbi:hypothetical protein AYL99_03003 [Fonsecaea erecta]|uniref:Xylanolytic transcriptional activator regulatory domain-containing protein n=1 Tax=Fonsecaea erecta TaxID=1367422 RepID=A0A178ZWJ0_9EURO|nr:hypothetical protein AYL99_03003 [Fonsecaea erecta]OAP63776.1 hypothetical protein AYL99_03003 [Fonsecaea erecta]
MERPGLQRAENIVHVMLVGNKKSLARFHSARLALFVCGGISLVNSSRGLVAGRGHLNSDLDTSRHAGSPASLQELYLTVVSTPTDDLSASRNTRSRFELGSGVVGPFQRSSPQRCSWGGEQDSGVEPLEEYCDATAHFLGFASEQDPHLLSTFRSNILNETSYVDAKIRQVFAGNDDLGQPPIHFSIIRNRFPEPDQRVKRQASDLIETHVGNHGDALVRLFFRFVHPTFPILSKRHFLEAYRTAKLGISTALRGVVYGLATVFWQQDETLRCLDPIDQGKLFELAHLSLNRELDSPKLSTLQAALLILHELPQATGTLESPRIWAMSSQAVSCAQSLGLYRDPSRWQIPRWEKCLRKKLWWAVYLTDKFSSIGHGNPSHIADDGFDTPALEMADLACDEDISASDCLLPEEQTHFDIQNASHFLEMIRLSQQLSHILERFYSIKCVSSDYLHETRGDALRSCLAQLEAWYALLPQCLTMDYAKNQGVPNMHGSLHLAYFAVKTLVFRALMFPATPASKANPCSELRQNLPEALSQSRAFINYVAQIRAGDTEMFWGRHARSNLLLAGNFLVYLFLLAVEEVHVKNAYDLLESYHNSLCYLVKVSDSKTMGLIRPAVLRSESFFQQAPWILRHGFI